MNMKNHVGGVFEKQTEFEVMVSFVQASIEVVDKKIFKTDHELIEYPLFGKEGIA